MEILIITILIILIVIVIFSFFYLISKRNSLTPNIDNSLTQQLDKISQKLENNSLYFSEQLNTKINDVQKLVNDKLVQINSDVNARLRDNANVLQNTNENIGKRLDNATNVIGVIQNKLGSMDEAYKKIYEIGQSMHSLQNILQSPKLRGGFGELLLEKMLSEILPIDKYSMQHTFKNLQTVDAIIRFKDNYIIPIDSKFPLENFRRIIEESNEEEKAKFKRLFLSDVKKHIDSISSKYILPDENTSDFALMYIAAENIYYEIILRDEDSSALLEYAFSKKVIPVSPNTFSVYLNTIIMGFKGMEIEKNTQIILANIKSLEHDLKKFQENFSMMGKHLQNARSKYDDSSRSLDSFTYKLNQVNNNIGYEEVAEAIENNGINLT